MISVVIPLYNKEKSITTTLESVFAQSYTDYEIIVVDDGSTDNSAAVVQSIISKRPMSNVKCQIRLISKPNGGVCSARNRGIEEARGEYIALLDADDQWDKDYLSEQVRMMREFPKAAMWGINYAEMYNGRLVRQLATGLPEGYRGYVENYFQMPNRVSDLFCSSNVVIRKDVFEKVGMFDERIKYAEDSDMWYRIIATHPVAFYDQYMVFYRWDAENRVMNNRRELRYFLPYYIDKYHTSLFKHNEVFYRWINRWCANRIRLYYFSNEEQCQRDAKEAATKLDYSVIPFKYRFLFGLPYKIARKLNNWDNNRYFK